MRKLIAGNWKMNGLAADGLALAQALADRARAA
jgi:triosephosphate isomerase